MPNWCNNFLTIDAPTKELLQEFWSKVDGEEPFSFYYWFPIPEEQLDNWFEWSYENWGTKWDVDCPHIQDKSDTKISIRFNTAWSPPRAFLLKVSKDYPQLKFTLSYDEIGMDYFGFYEIQDGEIVNNEEYKIKSCEYLMRDEDPHTYCFARRIMKERIDSVYTMAWWACEDSCEECEETIEENKESESETSESE